MNAKNKKLETQNRNAYNANMQTCKHANMQTCKHANMQTCKHANM